MLVVTFLYGCSESPVKPTKNKTAQVDRTIKTVPVVEATPLDTADSISYIPKNRNSTKKKDTEKFFHPNMSRCGGALYGIYRNGELIRIESRYGAEFGYSEKNIDFKNGEILKIAYREHFAEYDKYRINHPDGKGFDPKKMTFSDTLHLFEFGTKNSYRKMAGKKVISTKVDEELTTRLRVCAETMKKELASEKVPSED